MIHSNIRGGDTVVTAPPIRTFRVGFDGQLMVHVLYEILADGQGGQDLGETYIAPPNDAYTPTAMKHFWHIKPNVSILELPKIVSSHLVRLKKTTNTCIQKIQSTP